MTPVASTALAGWDVVAPSADAVATRTQTDKNRQMRVTEENPLFLRTVEVRSGPEEVRSGN